ncbi:MAG: DUF3048 domain-containing protein [Ilumatobacteraceae bacterium]|jgi:hypothetical protein
MNSSPKTAAVRFASLIAASAVLLAACGGGEGATVTVAAETVPSSAVTTVATTAPAPSIAVTTTTVAVELPTYPLTGLPITDAAWVDRPALIAKIDNAPGAWPQSGLVAADIVYEENVESWTRFAAVFHSQGSDPVGPIRSGRTQDISLGTSLDRPLLVWSGGNATVTSLINKSDLVNMSVAEAGPNGGYYRSSDKRAPHNLFTKTSAIWAAEEGRGGRPSGQFAYRRPDAPVPGAPAAGVKLKMDGNMRSSWEWDERSGTYLRSHKNDPHVEADGTRVSTHNVVVLVCEYKTSVADSRSPEAQTTGEGPAWVFTGGSMVVGTWTRADKNSGWTLTADDGTEIELTPGRTWVQLIRKGQAVEVPAGQALDDVDWP